MKQILLLFSLCTGFAYSISAQCIKGDCQNGNGTYLYKSGAKYIGEFRDGKIEGIGALHYSDGRRYVGHWKNWRQEGNGIMHYPDGQKFAGSWSEGIYQNGQLPSMHAPKDQNSEEIPNTELTHNICNSGDCEDGIGVCVLKDTHIYEGQFKNGKPNGYGILFQSDDATVISEGIWEAGQFVGEVNNSAAFGCLSGNCLDGEGVYQTIDGSKYIGNFSGGSFQGFGICFYQNEDKYVGEWRRGIFHGHGTMLMEDGVEIAGTWNNGRFIKSDLDVIKPNEANHNHKFDPAIKVWAVVVGVARYNHMPTLNYTDDDAYRVAMFLRSPEGGALPQNQIAILIDEDATRKNIIERMRSIFSQADSNDVVMLYFSGHGLKGSFLPTDYNGMSNQLLHEEVKFLFNESAAKHRICIADACHSGSLNTLAARSATNSSSALIKSYYTAFSKIRGGTALLLSSKAEETSLESSGLRQGIFSHFLIRGLMGEAETDGDKVVSIIELYQYVNRNVLKYTGNLQTPILEGDYDPKMPIGVIGR